MTILNENEIQDNSKKFKIMIVEDSLVTLRQYKDEIKDQYDADFFEDARSALSHYKNAEYDLVITDLMLPLKSGEGLIFDIKYANPKQKIAVISGSPDYLHLKEYDNIQVFEKPVKVCDVIKCVLLGKALPKSSKEDLHSRRKYQRFNVDLKATVLTPNPQEKIPVHVTNVSLGGLFFEGQIPNFDTLHMELPLLDQKLFVNVKKCWEKEGQGVGAKFQNIGHSEYSVLELFLESLKG